MGTQGMLEIGDEYILYKTAVPKDSRIWRYQDISSVGTTGPYQIRLTSMDRAENESGGERNFVFSLKERLTPEAYDLSGGKSTGCKYLHLLGNDFSKLRLTGALVSRR
jgi:hypothetical protein